MIEEGGDGESVDSEDPSLLSYTLRYVSLTDLDRLFQFGLLSLDTHRREVTGAHGTLLTEEGEGGDV